MDYFKALVGNLKGGFSINSTQERSREVSAGDLSFDEERDPFSQIKDGELPHLGNYKRPLGHRQSEEEDYEDKLVLSRQENSSVSQTAGLFFVACLMCVMCLTSLTLTGGSHSEGSKREFTVENPNRHLMDLQKQHEDATSFLRITMWLIMFISIGIAFFTRISLKEGKKFGLFLLIKCHIINDPAKKTKYS